MADTPENKADTPSCWTIRTQTAIQEPKATSCGKLELGGEIGGSGSEHGFHLEAAFGP